MRLGSKNVYMWQSLIDSLWRMSINQETLNSRRHTMANDGWCLTMKGSNEVVPFCKQKHKSSWSYEITSLLSKCSWFEMIGKSSMMKPMNNRNQVEITTKQPLKHMGVSKNRGTYSQIIHFNKAFHYKPSTLGCFPIFGNIHVKPGVIHGGFLSQFALVATNILRAPFWKKPMSNSSHCWEPVVFAKLAAYIYIYMHAHIIYT